MHHNNYWPAGYDTFRYVDRDIPNLESTQQVPSRDSHAEGAVVQLFHLKEGTSLEI